MFKLINLNKYNVYFDLSDIKKKLIVLKYLNINLYNNESLILQFNITGE